MKLSRTVAYALQATLQLALSGDQEPVPCSRLAAEGKMPERFLLQILRNLVAHGILSSTRGVDGGYTLDRAPEEISLLASERVCSRRLTFARKIAEVGVRFVIIAAPYPYIPITSTCPACPG